jgi:hypothetical protein
MHDPPPMANTPTSMVLCPIYACTSLLPFKPVTQRFSVLREAFAC